MSEQILLQGKILGIEEFLLSSTGAPALAGLREEELLSGRAQWISLLSEVLPRALLAEFGLARILLGSSGGGQFLLVLPGEFRGPAQESLAAAARDIALLSDGHLRLIWAVTENLGDWITVRKRLNEELTRRRGAPLAGHAAEAFRAFDPAPPALHADYFCMELGRKVREAHQIAWSPESPARIVAGEGKHAWRLTPNLSADGIVMARHAAPDDAGHRMASLEVLARRSDGRPGWGVLRGDVDHFGVRLRRLSTIEEHVSLSVLSKQFFAGEIEVLCSMPDFWRKVTVLYTGGNDFAVYGAWDALIPLAREIQRLFHRFAEENLKDFPGPEGKTITMGLALGDSAGATLASVYEEAGRNLALAKAADKDCIYVLGRVLEWKRLGDASELKDIFLRMEGGERLHPQALLDLRGIYSKVSAAGPLETAPAVDRVWRFHRRLRTILGAGRDKEFQKLRNHLAGEIAGRKTTQVKLRPSGLVAIEWARLLLEAGPRTDLFPAPEPEAVAAMAPAAGVEHEA